MKVILQQEVKKLGKQGDILDVSEGYARNYLLPHKLAIEATSTNVNAVKQHKASEARKSQQQIDEARVMASQLKKVSVDVTVKIGEGGRLFGSVTGKDIAEALRAQYDVDIDKRKIELQDTIKGVGTYTALIRVHPEITAQIQVNVKPQ